MRRFLGAVNNGPAPPFTPRLRPAATPIPPAALFLSDLHLGRGTPAEQRAAERDAVGLLDAHADALTAGAPLVLAGDVFEQWIEYRHLAPKGFVRFVGRLAALADGGAEVVYVVGNRDPWHLDLFEREVGARLVRGAVTLRLAGRRVYIAHGDLLAPPAGRDAASARGAARSGSHGLKPLLRRPTMARLYRMGLPGDAGYAFARWFARRFGTDGAPRPHAAAEVRERARRVLAAGHADVVVMGHSHQPECAPLAGGTFLNPGYWFAARTFGLLDADGTARLLRWSGGRAAPFAAEPHPALATA